MSIDFCTAITFTRELRHLYYFVKVLNEILENALAGQKSIDIITKNI